MIFHFIITGRNVENSIANTIRSVLKQDYQNFFIWIYLDNPSDGTFQVVEEFEEKDKRIRIYVNPERRYACYGRWFLLNKIEYDLNDVAILLDGDDHLANPHVLSKLLTYYESVETVVTYGNYKTQKGDVCDWSGDYSTNSKLNNEFREEPWIATHLRSFKIALIEHLEPALFKENTGVFFKDSTDMALFLPILELAGKYSIYINEVLYIYNDSNIQDRKCDQSKTEVFIRTMPKKRPLNYKKISSLF